MRRIYRLPNLREIGITYSDVHLRRLEARGAFPKRFKLVPGSGPHGSVGWNVPEVDAYLESLIAARDTEAA
jgi:predicted DNA-binding transcriptional regulator AlpA